MKFHRPTVLILSSAPAFSRDLTAHWPSEAGGPEFVVLEQDLCSELQGDTFDLAIADAPSDQTLARLKKTLVSFGKSAIVIRSGLAPEASGGHSSGNVTGNATGHAAILTLSREPASWATQAGLLGREILRRRHAESRAREAEELGAAAAAEATLGRYMVEMRHTVNNALTSVLGNAELLVVEPGLPATVLAQADTIRNMALRLHEVFQRFSSIEKELSVVARESGKKTGQARAAANGR